MKIVFAGTTTHAAQVLEHLAASNHHVVSVLTRNDAPVGRKSVLTPSPVAQKADELGIPIIKANKVTGEQNEQIAHLAPDLGVVIAYGTLLRGSTLAIPNHGWLNLHYSLLPYWRGAAPVQHSILSGEHLTGVSIFKLDEGMDTGPILSQVEAEIQPGETSGDLLLRLTHLGISALDECLAQLDSGLAVFKPQSGEPTLAKKLDREDARISWQKHSAEIELLIRAMNPEPMAWTLVDGQPFRVISARSTRLDSSEFKALDVGELHSTKSRVFVGCGGNTALELLKVQPSGKKEMSAADWYRGLNGAVAFNG